MPREVNFTPNAYAAYLRTQESKTNRNRNHPPPKSLLFSAACLEEALLLKAAEEARIHGTHILCSEESYELEKIQIQR